MSNDTKNKNSNYWIFQANPKQYDIISNLLDEEITDWRVTRYKEEFYPGDKVYFWKSGDERGIYGIGQILDYPYQKPDGDWVVDTKYSGRYSAPILSDELIKNETLSKLLIIQSPQGTNFKLSNEEELLISEFNREILPNTSNKDTRSHPQNSPYTARRVIERILPDIEFRMKCLDTFSLLIKFANSLGQDKWGIELKDDRIRLVFCPQLFATLHENRIWIFIDHTQLNNEEFSYIKENAETDLIGKRVDNSIGVNLDINNYDDLLNLVIKGCKSLLGKFSKKYSKLSSNYQTGHIPGVIRYLQNELNDPTIPDPVFSNKRSYWWVNQGKSYFGEKDQNIIWAPLKTKRGSSLSHWDLLQEVEPNDLIVHYSNKHVRAISKVRNAFIESSRPKGLDNEDWETMGRLIETEYFEFSVPIPWQSIQHQIVMLELDSEPFDSTGRIKQGYFYNFSYQGIKILFEAIEQTWPEWISLDSQINFGAKPMDKVKVLQNTFRKEGYYFTPFQIATFYTSLQTKGFVILSGISGTGKTKLAQQFANLFPKPREVVYVGNELIQVAIKPYMLKYNRLIIPKSGTRLFNPPAAGETIEIQLEFDGKTDINKLTHAAYSNTDYIQIMFRGDARIWFTENFKEGDRIFLEPLFEDDVFTGFKLLPEHAINMNSNSEHTTNNWLFVTVRPDWRDSSSLLGYFNPLTEAYIWTDFLRFLDRASINYDSDNPIPWFVILDEMNLARVEYYFADLLSVLESGRSSDGYTKEFLRLDYPEDAEGDLPPRKMHLPPNLYIIGTVNVDETTHAFSPKVLDRAFSIELNEADFNSYVSEQNDLDFREEDIDEIIQGFTRDGNFHLVQKDNFVVDP